LIQVNSRSDFSHDRRSPEADRKATKFTGTRPNSPEQGRQKRNHQRAPKQRSTYGENGVRDDFHHLNQWIIGGFRYSII